MDKIQRTHRRAHTLRQISAALLLAATSLSYGQALAPEAGSGIHHGPQKVATSAQQMVVTANHYASQAGVAILQQGGSAIDAAIAAQLVLGLVEPQSSGIGGGAFLVHYDAKKQKLISFDGRETAPGNVNSDYFLENNKPLDFYDAVVGGKSVGTPGVIAMAYVAHQQYGQLPWQDLFTPAINLAQSGFVVSKRLHTLAQNFAKRPHAKTANAALLAYLSDSRGQIKPVGSLLKNPAYAKTLQLIAKEGKAAFYQGSIAKAIINAVQNAPRQEGALSLHDLQQYQTIKRQSLCHTVKPYTLCGAPPPASGPLAVMQQVALLQSLPSAQGLAFDSPAFYHRFSETSKIAFADRNAFIADPSFAPFKPQKLLNENYINERASNIPLLQAGSKAKAGQLAHYQSAQSPELPSTSHLSVVDKQGNIVSMTSSIETAFGSGLFVEGFILNNQLTDFSFTPEKNGQLVANRIEPGKRPRSSMAPMIVFKGSQPVLAIGSPGGSRIINYVSKAIYQHLYLGTPLETAINSSHVTDLNYGVVEVEANKANSKRLQQSLKSLGHKVKASAQTSGIHAISINTGLLKGVADNRREGTAAYQ